MVLLASSVCLLVDEAKSFCELLNGRDRVGKTRPSSGWQGLAQLSLIQLSADGWGYVPFLLVIWLEVTQPWGLWAL